MGALVVVVASSRAAAGDPSRGTTLAAVLPQPAGRLGPSRVELAPGRDLPGATQMDVDSCVGCHPDVVAGWRESAHSFASFNNPIYRVAIERLRAERGPKESRFCAGCHDVPLLLDGLLDGPTEAIRPDDARGHAGITCRTCHGIEAVAPDGNASFRLTAHDIPMPVDGDAASVVRHVEAVALRPLRTTSLCASCHRSFLGPETGNAFHLPAQEDATAHAASEYGGSSLARIDDVEIGAKSCQSCHMPREAAPLGDRAATGGRIASHRFTGAHTWLAAMRGDAADVARAKEFLRGAASIDIAIALHADGTRSLPADGTSVRAGERLLLDVVVRNLRAGHRFPGGVVDAQDTWIDLAVTDARGRLIAEAGTRHAAGAADETAHVLTAVVLDEQGRPLLERETHRFRTPVYNHTIPPRDAHAVRYALGVPAGLGAADLPLRVTARLRHRTRNLALHAAACADARTPRGRAFRIAGRRLRGVDLDACVAQPITEVATAEVFLGGSAPAAAPAPRPRWRRLYEHGLAWLRGLQEKVDEARPSLEAALAELERTGGAPRDRAMVLAALAELEVRQWRLADALARLDEAERLLPGHPALTRIRGDAYAQVWRFAEALAPYRLAAAAAPVDPSIWRRLALAAQSAGAPGEALAAAARGLALIPRDGELLRVQALALRELGAPAALAASALAASLEHRVADDAPRLRGSCSKHVPGCALERDPVHVHELRAPAPR